MIYMGWCIYLCMYIKLVYASLSVYANFNIIQVQEEVRHIWPGQAAKPAGTHNAARKLLDGVKAVADTVGAYSSKPTKILSDWVADQVAPPYWVPNNEIVVSVLMCLSWIWWLLKFLVACVLILFIL